MSAVPFQRTLPAVHNSRPAELDLLGAPIHMAEGGQRIDTRRMAQVAPGFVADDTEADVELGVSTARGGLRVLLVSAAMGVALLAAWHVIPGGAR